jgi:hypothetical protein
MGRLLGIGVRVASRAGNRALSTSGQSATARPTAPTPRPTARQLGHATRQGLGGFWRNVRRASGIVWLQVTGCFFFLPVLVFAPTLWKTRMSYAHGPDHQTFVLCAIIIALFFYLGVSSFWRAIRRSAEK